MTSSPTLTAAVTPSRSARMEVRSSTGGHVGVLDGWRGISILLVLGCHLMPLGPSSWLLNAVAGATGMSLFFTLSGFLITTTLDRQHDVTAFFVRRAVRILPTFLAYMLIMTLLIPALRWRGLLEFLTFRNNYSFAWAGIDDSYFLSHLWSICVEVHFYVFIGLLMAISRFRGFWLLPALAVAVTLTRIWSHAYIHISTHLRVDEILAGATLALVWASPRAGLLRQWMAKLPVAVPLVLLLASAHPRAGWLQYLRPYFGALTVGASLSLSRGAGHRVLTSRALAYIATISYALYVWHKLGTWGWLGSGTGLVKYAKRPLTFALAFGIAHLSTFYLEHPCIDGAKRLLKRRAERKAARSLKANGGPASAEVASQLAPVAVEMVAASNRTTADC